MIIGNAWYNHCACILRHFSHFWLFETPWTVACQTLLCMGFSRQEHWSGLPCSPLPNPVIKPESLMSPPLADRFFTTSATLEVWCDHWDLADPWSLITGSVVKNLPANAGDMSFIPGLGRCPGEVNGNPLPYSCLGNPMDEEPGRLHSVGSQKSGTRLSY